MDDVHVHPMSSSSKPNVFLWILIRAGPSIYDGTRPLRPPILQGYERGERGPLELLMSSR